MHVSKISKIKSVYVKFGLATGTVSLQIITQLRSSFQDIFSSFEGSERVGPRVRGVREAPPGSDPPCGQRNDADASPKSKNDSTSACEVQVCQKDLYQEDSNEELLLLNRPV